MIEHHRSLGPSCRLEPGKSDLITVPVCVNPLLQAGVLREASKTRANAVHHRPHAVRQGSVVHSHVYVVLDNKRENPGGLTDKLGLEEARCVLKT
jgi:hypothetical protein